MEGFFSFDFGPVVLWTETWGFCVSLMAESEWVRVYEKETIRVGEREISVWKKVWEREKQSARENVEIDMQIDKKRGGVPSFMRAVVSSSLSLPPPDL